jgi:hypothetical protein
MQAGDGRERSWRRMMSSGRLGLFDPGGVRRREFEGSIVSIVAESDDNGWQAGGDGHHEGRNFIVVKPAVGFTLPSAGVTPAPSTSREMSRTTFCYQGWAGELHRGRWRVLQLELQLRKIACLSLCHLERSERSRAQARKIAVRMGFGWLSGSLACSREEGEGERPWCGANV